MTASEVADYVTEHPGVHFNALVYALGMTPERLLQVAEELKASNTITVAEFYGKSHFYPPGYDSREREVIALLRRETSRDILLTLLAEGSASPAAVVAEVGIARSTLEWHLDRLIEADLVRKERDGWAVQLHLESPDETKRLLADLQPSLPDRWLDRTERLLDHLLEEW